MIQLIATVVLLAAFSYDLYLVLGDNPGLDILRQGAILWPVFILAQVGFLFFLDLSFFVSALIVASLGVAILSLVIRIKRLRIIA